jgi:hypothetical protein
MQIRGSDTVCICLTIGIVLGVATRQVSASASGAQTTASQTKAPIKNQTNLASSATVSSDGDTPLSTDNEARELGVATRANNEPSLDLFTGILTMSIPIQTPAGRGGVMPHLALAYNSSLSNGWIGVGWTVDVGAIQRNTLFGLDFDCDENDEKRPCYELSMNGMAQPLIKTQGALFRPKKESSFLRIRKIDNGTSPFYWEVTDKSGTRYLFGETPQSRQEADGNTFNWGLDRVVDRNGNFMAVKYTKEDGELYLARIDYTGGVDLPSSFAVIFVPEDSPRVDFAQMFNTGFPVSMRRRLHAIDVCAIGTSNDHTESQCPSDNGGSLSLIRRYLLRYQPSRQTQDSLLYGVSLLGKHQVVSSSSTLLNYQREATTQWSPPIPMHLGPTVNQLVRKQCLTGDFNGDGTTDLACYTGQAHHWHVALRTGLGFGQGCPNYCWDSGPAVGPEVSAQCLTGDFNGDGKTDLACYTQNQNDPTDWDVALSTGSGFNASCPSSCWHGPPAGANVSTQCAVGDFNGDGISDIACVQAGYNRWSVALSNGSGFQPAPDLNLLDTGCFIGDFKGHGSADFACRDSSDPNGTSWKIAELTPAGWSVSQWVGPRGSCAVVDENLDGLSDLSCIEADHSNHKQRFYVAFSTGSNFKVEDWGTGPSTSSTASYHECIYGDFNGDRRTDLACYFVYPPRLKVRSTFSRSCVIPISICRVKLLRRLTTHSNRMLTSLSLRGTMKPHGGLPTFWEQRGRQWVACCFGS